MPRDGGCACASRTRADDRLQTLVVGGVPEHFNAPFHIGIESGIFAAAGVRVEWVDCYGGTGEMLSKLRSGELDVVVALTEALIAGAVQTPEHVRLVGSYTASRLHWAVNVARQSPHTCINDLRGKTLGISRYGSGSHIMGNVMASARDWPPFQWTVCKDFEGLRNAVNEGHADAFLWEKFTTKPFHITGEVKSIGEVVTPWPAFMLASRAAVLDDDAKRAAVVSLLDALAACCATFRADREAAIARVVRDYGNTAEDAGAWFDGFVQYAPDLRAVDAKVVEYCLDTLRTAGALAESSEGPIPPPSDLCDARVARIA